MITPFSAFIYDADKIPSITYQNQREGENVKLFLRQHIFTNFRWLIPVLILLAIPMIFIWRYQSLEHLLTIFPVLADFGIQIITAIIIIYCLAIIFYGLIGFYFWYFNILMVTDKRIVDLTYKPPLSWQIAETQLDEIQDVRYTQGGIWGVLLNYGNIYVQTAGTNQNIMIDKVPNPQRVHDLIIQMMS